MIAKLEGEKRGAHATSSWLGLGLYGAAFLLYAAALSRLPLNVAYHMLTLGAVVAVALSSILLLQDPLYWT